MFKKEQVDLKFNWLDPSLPPSLFSVELSTLFVPSVFRDLCVSVLLGLLVHGSGVHTAHLGALLRDPSTWHDMGGEGVCVRDSSPVRRVKTPLGSVNVFISSRKSRRRLSPSHPKQKRIRNHFLVRLSSCQVGYEYKPSLSFLLSSNQRMTPFIDLN